MFKGKEELAGEERDERLLQEVSERVKGDRDRQERTRTRQELERGEQMTAGWWESPAGAGSGRSS